MSICGGTVQCVPRACACGPRSGAGALPLCPQRLSKQEGRAATVWGILTPQALLVTLACTVLLNPFSTVYSGCHCHSYCGGKAIKNSATK